MGREQWHFVLYVSLKSPNSVRYHYYHTLILSHHYIIPTRPLGKGHPRLYTAASQRAGDNGTKKFDNWKKSFLKKPTGHKRSRNRRYYIKREVGWFDCSGLSWAVADGRVRITKPPLKFRAGWSVTSFPPLCPFGPNIFKKSWNLIIWIWFQV